MSNDPKADALKHQASLSTEAARNLSTTTKSAPQMQGITSRWLLKVLPWIQVSGGVYRVNRRLTYSLGDGRVSVSQTGAVAQVIPQELCELPLFRNFDNIDILSALSSRFIQLDLKPGDVIAEAGKPAEFMYLIAHGKANKLAAGKYGEEAIVAVIAGGEYFGDKRLIEPNAIWDYTIKAITTCTVLALPRKAFEELLTQSESLRTHVERFKLNLKQPRDNSGEASIALSADHHGEVELPSTFVDYETKPREYELSIAQTVLQVHSRVADLYNQPMNQIEQQLRLTVEALREQQEHEMINNRSFGLLHNADFRQRINTKSGPPTPDDLDELLSIVWKEPSVFLAHPRTIAAFGQECSKRGLYPHGIEIAGHSVPAWRGVPILPCNKIPISDTRTSSIMLMRTGEKNQGVIGLHQTGIPDEIEPSLSARFMGINDRALISYLVTAYFSAAVLVPDALGVLEDVQIGR